MVLEQVAFDIETSGFDAVVVVATVGCAVPMGVRVFLQTADRDASGIESAVESEVSETLVNVSTHASERELLVEVSEFVAERFSDGDVLLVAYNGERWNGGFDVPFLRTRYAQCDLAWPFVDVPYADVMPLVTDRFNTTVDGTEQGGLVAAYDVLCGRSYGDVDPFDDSVEAVATFEDGRFAPLVLHNVADVLWTRALGRVAERYCSKSEFKVKSLTPTRSI